MSLSSISGKVDLLEKGFFMSCKIHGKGRLNSGGRSQNRFGFVDKEIKVN